jgi:hypothetical protein
VRGPGFHPSKKKREGEEKEREGGREEGKRKEMGAGGSRL